MQVMADTRSFVVFFLLFLFYFVCFISHKPIFLCISLHTFFILSLFILSYSRYDLTADSLFKFVFCFFLLSLFFQIFFFRYVHIYICICGAIHVTFTQRWCFYGSFGKTKYNNFCAAFHTILLYLVECYCCCSSSFVSLYSFAVGIYGFDIMLWLCCALCAF